MKIWLYANVSENKFGLSGRKKADSYSAGLRKWLFYVAYLL